MNYYFYNNDVKSLCGRRRTHILLDQGLAVTGGPRTFGKQLGQLTPGDRLVMYEDGIGVVAVGEVKELWDRKSYRTPIYYVLGESLLEPACEYRIRVHWFLDLRNAPISIRAVKQRLGYQPRGAVKRIIKWRNEIEKMIAEYTSSRFVLPEEVIDTGGKLAEGSKQTVTVNAYERNSHARAECIEHWGLECAVCGVLLEDVYGDLGAGYIHVHHLVPLSEVGREYEVDPIADMKPVCPNCHAMLHRKDPPYTMGELRERFRKRPTSR